MPCKRTLRISSRRNRLGSAGLAEFAPTIFVLVFITFPLINLMGAVTGYACATLAAWQAARRASVSYDIPHALEAMSNEVTAITASGFGSFARLEPINGFKDCGSDLYIEATDVYSGKTETYGPNKGVPPPVDTASHVYEAMTKVTMNVGPAISMAAIPGLSNIQGLGKPAQFQIAWRRAIEHPDNMTAATQKALDGGTTAVQTGPLLANNGSNPATHYLDESGWNHPDIYDLIRDAGQQVVAEDVIQVRADNAVWTSPGLEITPGEKLWIDYRADGVWNHCSPLENKPDCNADGDMDMGLSSTNGFPAAAMIGKIGSTTMILGIEKQNFVPPATGPLSFMCNDGGNFGYPGVLRDGTIPADTLAWQDNRGTMTVRVIITR